MAEEEKPRVFLVDDHDLFRAGVRSELGDQVEVIGEASEVEPAIEMIRERLPDVVLLDVYMPGGGGKAVIEGVLPAAPEVRFLGISMSDKPSDVVSLIRAGARGYMTKRTSTAELVDAIQRVAEGDAAFSRGLAGFVLDAFSSVPDADVDPEVDQLTPREREVLQYIARGYTYRDTAESLYISVKTVESHVSSVLRKLQLSNRSELTRWASDQKLV